MKPEHSHEARPLWQRLAWMLGLWCVSVLALGGMAYLLRLFMRAAGLGA